MVRESADGFIVRKFKDLFKQKVVDNFGGEEGMYSKFLSNYSNKKSVMDAVDEIVKAYRTRSPIKMNTALNNIKNVFSENKAAFIDALADLEKLSGVDIMTGLSKRITHPFLPAKSGKFSWDELFRLVLIPVTSPRMVQWYVKYGTAMQKLADRTGTGTAFKVMLLTALLGGESKVKKEGELSLMQKAKDLTE